MYPIPPSETLIETKVCRHCQASFPITDKDLEFYEKVSPVFPRPVSDETGLKGENKKYLIPTPTLCPDCRQQRRLSFRNERKLYKRKCDATGKSIVSVYSPDKKYTVYSPDYWNSDSWNPLDYGKEINWDYGFLEQFEELLDVVPRISIQVEANENSEYVSQAWRNKNCYLIFEAFTNEDCLYSGYITYSQYCVDCLWCAKCSYLYGCIDCTWCHNSQYLINCEDTSNSSFLRDCTGCEYCFDSENLVNRKYVFSGEQLSKEDYEKKITNAKPRYLTEHVKTERYIHGSNNLDVTGGHILYSKNITCGFFMQNSEDCKWVANLENTKDCYDINIFGWTGLEHSYECHCVWVDVYGIIFSDSVILGSRDCMYSYWLRWCSSCFLCAGLTNKSYCILNKQYTKDEYEVLVPKIIEHMMKTGEWWEFFPSSLSPFGYNETVAQEYYPMTREEILKNPLEKGGRSGATGGLVAEVNWVEKSGLIWSNPPASPRGPSLATQFTLPFLKGEIFNWSDYEAPFPKVEKIITVETRRGVSLLDDITKVPDDILNWAIECEVTRKPFRIIKQELEFYRKHNLPIPRRHPDQRHLDRMALRNPRKLFERKCDCCSKDMITTYAPERPERVYCEECYNREVVG